ncbi:hypothetical protein KIN20_016496 [Parelaphostrongylus tenuis]|uniref:Uncharacterized protein n=1 Tax=Parelaphostrongylus tenuis TaxID=148309 RepID=A0AAD5MK40_PARTN|nr:hypothetical protein KIN20_016496 [Parelaphostrongylus tenuis]
MNDNTGAEECCYVRSDKISTGNEIYVITYKVFWIVYSDLYKLNNSKYCSRHRGSDN